MNPADLQLRTERLLLFVPGPEDAPRMLEYALRNREHLRPWEPNRALEYWSLDHWERQLTAAREEAERGDGLRTAFVGLEDVDGPILGVANLSQIFRGAFQSSMLGYSIDREHEGKGFMREALAALVEFAFRDLGLHRVQANYRPENVRSARVLDRLGFEREGLAPRYLYIDGAWRDHVLTAKLAPGE